MTERRYTLEQVTGAMGEALKGLDAGAEFPRLWRLFTEATVDKLKALPDPVVEYHMTEMGVDAGGYYIKTKGVKTYDRIASPND